MTDSKGISNVKIGEISINNQTDIYQITTDKLKISNITRL